MDKIQKALKRLTEQERQRCKTLLLQIERGELKGLDIKKLKDRDDIYRVRKGNMRIIFRKHKDAIYILALERRTSTTYKH